MALKLRAKTFSKYLVINLSSFLINNRIFFFLDIFSFYLDSFHLKGSLDNNVRKSL